MAKRKKAKLIEKQGSAIVINKKWCLRILGLFLMGYALAAFVLPLPIIRLPWFFAIGVACLIVAEFTDD